ncbi:MAG: 30S ribosomal protein S6, partial [Planctomycetales bacterium]
RSSTLTENIYEGLFILDSKRYGRDPAAISGRISELIENQGGTVLVSRLWEERRLAYPINGQRKGTYWLSYFRIEGGKIGPLNEQAGRDENLLRHVVIRIDPRIADTLISHAQQTDKAVAPVAAAQVVEESKPVAVAETES